MTTPFKKPSEKALDDVLEVFEDPWKITMTPNGKKALIAIFKGSLGRYLEEIEKLNKVDVWGARHLSELPGFILGYVVGEIGQALEGVPRPLDEFTLPPIVQGIMDADETHEFCKHVVDSYEKKVEHPVTPTPICGDKRPRP